jgi:hypothetical protein
MWAIARSAIRLVKRTAFRHAKISRAEGATALPKAGVKPQAERLQMSGDPQNPVKPQPTRKIT